MRELANFGGLARVSGPRSAFAFAVALCVACERPGDAAVSQPGTSSQQSDSTPLRNALTIGEDAKHVGPNYEFGSILDLVITPTGNIWVLDANHRLENSTPQIRIFDSAGTFVSSVSRKGGGPGEFLEPFGLALLSDGRVAVRDAWPDRVLLFRDGGQFESAWPLPRGARWARGLPQPIQLDSAGLLWLPLSSGRPGRGTARQMSFWRVEVGGQRGEEYSGPDLPQVSETPLSTTRQTATGGIVTRGLLVPYLPYALWSWTPFQSYATARSDQYRIEVRGAKRIGNDETATDTHPPTIVERSIPRVPVGHDERAAIDSALRHEAGTFEGGRSLEIPAIAKWKPVLRGIAVAEDGGLIVKVSAPSVLDHGIWVEPNVFDVFDRKGTFVRRLVFPAAFRLFRLRGAQAWGVFASPDGIETIRRYEMEVRNDGSSDR